MKSNDRPLTVDTTLHFTGEVVYIDIYFKDRTPCLGIRIPMQHPVDKRYDGGITYTRILEQVDTAFNFGGEGHLQLPHYSTEQEFSSMFYALVANINGVMVHPPIMEESDDD